MDSGVSATEPLTSVARTSSGQEEGLIGRLVGGMIRRSVKKQFRRVYWSPPARMPEGPVVFVCTHHGWFDGYLMFHVVSRLGKRSLDWIQEFGAFPLFRYVGGMPFPLGDAAGRAKTLRQTVRLMRGEKRSLVLFAEGTLHVGPEIWEIGDSLRFIAKQVPEATLIPTAIHYQLGIHQRPEAFIAFGEPLVRGENLLAEAREKLQALLDQTSERAKQSDGFEILVQGTLDVNERMDMRQIPGAKR